MQKDRTEFFKMLKDYSELSVRLAKAEQEWMTGFRTFHATDFAQLEGYKSYIEAEQRGLI